MPLYESLVRPIAFLLDPEKAHNLGLWAVQHGLAKAKTPDRATARNVFGVRFPNPVGLAAGFDKNGVALERWKDLGFGFVEIGTVTRHQQPGNPKPRMFRLPEHHAVINRLGFNNDGADAVAARIEGKNAGIPVGINLGKSKVTPNEEAHEDYAYSYRLLKEFADYVVVNVSSPNTPGLRALQDKDSLTRILSTLKEIDERKPLLVKIAPDLTLGAIEDVVGVAIEMNLAGMICTNTTVSREMLPSDPRIDGGLSGEPLREIADEVLKFVRETAGDKLSLIGVGGVMLPEHAVTKLSLGADLVQVYTGWVYNGPQFVPRILRVL